MALTSLLIWKCSIFFSVATMEEPKEEVDSDVELPIVDQSTSPEELAAKRPRIESPPAPNFSDVIIVSEDEEDMEALPLRKPVIKPLRAAPSPEDPDIIDLEDSDTESLNDAGSHVNDENNKLDQYGRVLVNVGHPEDEPDLYVAPQIAAALKPHQVSPLVLFIRASKLKPIVVSYFKIGGIRFLYDNVIESTAEISKKGFGCILAHAMGLGKTIQIISLTDIALRLAKFKTILILVPINTIQVTIYSFDFFALKGTCNTLARFLCRTGSASSTDGCRRKLILRLLLTQTMLPSPPFPAPSFRASSRFSPSLTR